MASERTHRQIPVSSRILGAGVAFLGVLMLAAIARTVVAWSIVAPSSSELDALAWGVNLPSEDAFTAEERARRAARIEPDSWELQRYLALAIGTRSGVFLTPVAADKKDIEAGLAAARAALALAPARSQLWTLLASYEQVNGASVQQIEPILRQSYLTGPNEANVMRQRAGVVLHYWDEISPDLKDNALQDLDFLFSNYGSRPDFIRLYLSLDEKRRAILIDRTVNTAQQKYRFLHTLREMYQNLRKTQSGIVP